MDLMNWGREIVIIVRLWRYSEICGKQGVKKTREIIDRYNNLNEFQKLLFECNPDYVNLRGFGVLLVAPGQRHPGDYGPWGRGLTSKSLWPACPVTDSWPYFLLSRGTTASL